MKNTKNDWWIMIYKPKRFANLLLHDCFQPPIPDIDEKTMLRLMRCDSGIRACLLTEAQDETGFSQTLLKDDIIWDCPLSSVEVPYIGFMELLKKHSFDSDEFWFRVNAKDTVNIEFQYIAYTNAITESSVPLG